jgi:signal transduction histidine kinase
LRTRNVLEAELQRSSGDLELLAQELALRVRQRAAALAAAQAAQAEAERSSAFKGTLLHLVSHELRTPLSVLQLNVHLLQRASEQLPHAQQGVVEKLERGVMRLSHLMEAVIAYAELEAGRLKVRPTEVDLAALLQEVVEQHRPAAQRKLLRLDAQVPAEPVRVHTDARHLQLILTQLVSNALRFTQHGRVTLRLELPPGEAHCRIHVEDSGPGIHAQDQERIFHPFEQMEALLNKSKEGLGLGLPLVRMLAEALRGGVSVRSTQGLGSCFTLTLPLQEAVEQSA